MASGWKISCSKIDPVPFRTLTLSNMVACPSSNKWNWFSLRLKECLAHHFHITRRVVDSANDVLR